ncbi:MAG: hypothetical protein HQK50_01930 [Oligoflexia bacterium]|nr:hypothetical protein [Oligoflexia bacterium]MBF0364297.1 hypothetical protein [Oligoflexia bacterium]
MWKKLTLVFMLAMAFNSSATDLLTTSTSSNSITSTYTIPSRVFSAPIDEIWPILIQEMKRYELQLANKQMGQIKTRWIDNTEDENFYEINSASNTVLASKFNLLLQVNSVSDNSDNSDSSDARPMTKITIFKQQQLIRKRNLNKGESDLWITKSSDGVTEETIFYRIEHVMKNYALSFEQKTK